MFKPFKIKRYISSGLLAIFLLAISCSLYAAEISLGQAADNMLVPVGLFADAFHKLCYIIGGTFMFASGIQYKNYRDNPSAVRLSTPIVLFLLGLALVLLPIISMTSPGSQAALGNG